MDDFKITGQITKANEDQNMVFGWASIVEKDGELIKDHQGDLIKPEELEKAAYAYILESRKAGEMHKTIGVGKIVESMVFTKEKQEALGLKDSPLPIGWWIGFKVDPEVFEKIKDGTYKMFSIGGRGVREQL